MRQNGSKIVMATVIQVHFYLKPQTITIMSNSKKPVQLFTFLLLLLAGLFISTPSFAQADLSTGSNTQQGGVDPTPTPDTDDDNGIATPKEPCNKPSEVDWEPETPIAFNGLSIMDSNGDGEGIQIMTKEGIIIGASLISPTGVVPLVLISQYNSQMTTTNSSVWQTSSEDTFVFLTSIQFTNAGGQTQATAHGAVHVMCPE